MTLRERMLYLLTNADSKVEAEAYQTSMAYAKLLKVTLRRMHVDIRYFAYETLMNQMRLLAILKAEYASGERNNEHDAHYDQLETLKYLSRAEREFWRLGFDKNGHFTLAWWFFDDWCDHHGIFCMNVNSLSQAFERNPDLERGVPDDEKVKDFVNQFQHLWKPFHPAKLAD